MKRKMIGLAAAGVLTFAGCTFETNRAESGGPAASTGSRPAVAEATSGPFAVGEQVHLGDWTLVVNSAAPFTSPNQFSQPAEGSQFVAVDVSVTNNGSQPAAVSSWLCFKMADSTGQVYNQETLVGAPAAPNGEAAPGETVRGTVGYEVPTSATGLTLKFKCAIFSTGSASVGLGL